MKYTYIIHVKHSGLSKFRMPLPLIELIQTPTVMKEVVDGVFSEKDALKKLKKNFRKCELKVVKAELLKIENE